MKKKIITWVFLALTTVLLHDLMLVFGSSIIRGSVSFENIRSIIWERLTEAGDAQRYLQIAREGYVTEGADRINLVFYPLFPYLIRILSLGFIDLASLGMVISRLSLMGAAVCLYELVRCDQDEKTAVFSVLFMAVYPFSMFTVGVYTESLFLLLTVGCMLAIRKDKMVWCGVLGFLAALTRVQGMLMIFPAVYRIVAGKLGSEKRKICWKDAFVLLIPCGFAVYLGINFALHGNAFQFLIFEKGEPWYQTTRWLGDNIAQQYHNSLQFKGLEGIIYWPQIILYFLALLLLFLGIRQKMRMEYLLYGAVYLGFTYLSGWMISGGRYMLCCFPCFMVLAQWKSERGKMTALGISGSLFFLYSCMFLMGHAIM